MPLTDAERNVYMIIMTMDRNIKELMNARDALAATLPNQKTVRRVRIPTMAEIRGKRKETKR